MSLAEMIGGLGIIPPFFLEAISSSGEQSSTRTTLSATLIVL